MAKRICPECGCEIPENSGKCPECGYAFEKPSENSANNLDSAKKKNNKRNLVIIVVAAALIVVLALSLGLGLGLGLRQNTDGWNDLVENNGLIYRAKDDGTCYLYGCTDKAAAAITIPSVVNGRTVTGIGDSAFNGCDKLTSITIPDSVTEIGYMAFWNCLKLESIEIPDSLTSIADFAFEKCSGLTSISYKRDIASWCKIEGLVTLLSCGSDERKLYIDGKEITGNFVIPDGVTSIGSFAFYGCKGLTSVEIPDGVTFIDKSAFGGCSNLTSVVISDSVEVIESYAFSGNGNLTIYCEAPAKPDGWSSNWASYGSTIVWDCSNTSANN